MLKEDNFTTLIPTTTRSQKTTKKAAEAEQTRPIQGTITRETTTREINLTPRLSIRTGEGQRGQKSRPGNGKTRFGEYL